MRYGADVNGRSGSRIWMHGVCLLARVTALLVIGWIISGFFLWKHSRIPLPDGSGSVIYMARLIKIPSAEWNRKVRLETLRFKGQTRWIPIDPSGAWPVNVYWYAKKGNSGPYLRFHDPYTEYLVDLQRGTTLLMQRHNDGSVDVGKISTSSPHIGTVEDTVSGEQVRTVDGHKVYRLHGSVASEPGIYIGRIADVGNAWRNKATDGAFQRKYGNEAVVKSHFMCHCMAACLLVRCLDPCKTGLGWIWSQEGGLAIELFQWLDNFINENIRQGDIWSNPNPTIIPALRVNRMGASCGVSSHSCSDCCQMSYTKRRQGGVGRI